MTAQMSDRFVGTWRLVSFVSRGARGREVSTYGPRPVGLLIYDKGGRMSVQVARSDRHPSGSDETPNDAVDAYFGYFGGYTVDEGAATVTHHVEAGSVPSFHGTDQRRIFRLEDDRLVLTTPPERIDDSDIIYVAVWERLDRDGDA